MNSAARKDVVRKVHGRIVGRSPELRREYLRKVAAAKTDEEWRTPPSCGNLAHSCAASPADEKNIMLGGKSPNIGIVTAYNDMLSAHQPFADFPQIIRQAARKNNATAQVAGGVPAMCDGITQGRAGMELSLFSRDVIAMAGAVALSHDTYSAAIFLGVCDKIAPGMLITAAAFGHLPAIFAPAGPMPSGLPNDEKAKVREQFAAGKVGREELLAAEAASYHSPGTCTFYGTANTNQMMLELMGMQLPGSFVNPNTPLRDALTGEAVRILCKNVGRTGTADILTPAAFVNAVVGVLSTGGSTNQMMHLPAVARSCGIVLEWEDFAELSQVAPLLCRMYPNGRADVNHFHAAGGIAFLIGELLSAGLLVEEVKTVVGEGLSEYTREPFLQNDELRRRDGRKETLDSDVVRPASSPFSPHGGLAVLHGNLGKGVIKISALPPHIETIEAPARIFESQNAMMRAFHSGELDMDFICVVRFQGPRANGMPELHKLVPLLATLQNAGRKVALITDGRMSGAGGKVPAAIHIVPEAADGGALAKLRDGDLLRLDLRDNSVNIITPDSEWQTRAPASPDLSANESGCGRELFSWMRNHSKDSSRGGGVFYGDKNAQ
ncbi:MAG: phosphogluconate dehydratase [Gammaproteobacteria bacterium]